MDAVLFRPAPEAGVGPERPGRTPGAIERHSAAGEDAVGALSASARPGNGSGTGAPGFRVHAVPIAAVRRRPRPSGRELRAYSRSGRPGRPQPVRGLCGPRSKLTTDRSGNRARASPPMGTATSTSLPSHMTERCGRNP